MDEEVKDAGTVMSENDTGEIESTEDYTQLESDSVIIDDDSNIQSASENLYEQAVEEKEQLDDIVQQLKDKILSIIEAGEVTSEDNDELKQLQEQYTEGYTNIKSLDTSSTSKSSDTTNIVLDDSIDYDTLIKLLMEKGSFLYIDEDGNLMIDGEAVPKLKVIELEAEKIKAEVGEFKDLTTENFTAVNAKIDNLEVGDLTATNAKIENLEADVAKIGLLIGDNASIDDIQSLILTSKNVSIENALIKDAMIDTVSASKINAGVINTNTVSIQSEDGGISISDETMQFKDENDVVRIQIGRDTSNNFTFVLYDKDGKGQLINENGIQSSDAIADALIRNDHISDTANISGGKIDMSSLFESMNSDGTHTLKSSKIYFNDKKQTLDVVFNTMNDKVDGNSSMLNTQSTQINVIQGNISSLITDTTITDENGKSKLKDRYLVTEQTVDGLRSKVSDLETTYETVLTSSKTMYYLSTSRTELVGGEWKESATQQEGKYIWLKIVYTYTDGSTSESTPVCIQGADGNAGEGSTTYTWIRYADDENGTGISNMPDGKAYIGFAYNQTTAQESNNPNDYAWSRMLGEKGDQGVQGEKGSNTYTWIKYSDNANGNPCYDTPTSTTQYIGIAVNQTTENESGDYTKYTWSKFKGDQGVQGATGATGKGVSSITNYYLASASSSGVTTSTTGWTTTVQSMTSTKKYLWNYEKVTYTDNSTVNTTPCIIGNFAEDGNEGKGIKSITEYYQVSNSNTTAPTSWLTTVPTLTSTNKYLWNYEVITYTDNTTYTSSKRVIGTYGEQGATGATGKGVSSITNYYLATSSSSGVTTSTSGWTTTVQSVSSSKKYLWNYEKVTYTDNSTTSTTPCIIGAYGEQGATGATGKGIKSITEYYQVSSSNTTAPTSWLTTVPSTTTTNKYLWNYEVITYTDNTTYTSTKRVIGTHGATGSQGATGDKGQSLVSSTPQYYLSTSSTTQSGGSWSETMPTMTAGKYMWSRFKLVWENPSATTYTTPVLDKICEVIKGVDEHLSEVEQTANKISWLVKSGTSSSNMVLTDSMYSLITENITLSADNIKLEGYFSANNNFSIDLAGNMSAVNGTFSGNITGSTFSSTDGGFQVDDAGEVRGTDISTSGTLTGWDIVASGSLTAPWYSPSLTRDVTVYIKSDYTYPTLDGSSEIDFYHGAYFRSFADLLSVCPRNLNGYNLRVRMKSNLSELVEINGLNNGNLYIEMYGYTLNGYFQIKGHSLWAGIYGNTSGSTNTSTRGVIKPNIGYLYSDYRYAILAQTNKFYLYDVDIYKGKATDYPNNCISVSSGCRAYLNSIKAVNTPNCLLRCHASAHVYVASSTGTTSSTVFQAISGSIIVVNDTTQCGRPSATAQTYTSDNSQVFANNVTWDGVAQTGTNDNNDTSTTITKTVTIKSDNGYSWRTNGNYANSWSSDAVVRQGRWTSGYGMNVGYWFFDDDIYDILQSSSNTVTSIKIKITRQSGGNSASRTHYLRCHTYAKKSSSSSPTLLGTNVLNKSFSLAVGNSITISLTSSEISALKSNKARGFGLYTSDSTTGASGNYSCCSPTATVTITYKTTS